jgi:UDP-glucose 4-epimerase
VRKQLKESNVLIVGGAGFISSHLADRLLDEGVPRLVLFDNLFMGKRENIATALKRGAIFVEDDAVKRESLREVITKYSIDVVFDLATKPLVYSFDDPYDAFMVNVVITGNLLELQRQGLFETLCHYSSSEVYGTAVYEPMDERHPYNPTTTYAGGKAAADTMLKTWVSMFGLDAFIVRPFNNYGPRQNPDGPYAAVIPINIRRILQGEKPEIHGSGEQSRDFVFVKDTVDATVQLYDVLKPGEEVNVSAEGNISINNLMNKICEAAGYDGEIVRKDRRRADVDCHAGTNAYLKTIIDFNPTDIDSGLQQAFDYYKEIYLDTTD